MKWFRARVSPLPFDESALMRLAQFLETGLRSGRDWISVIRWISTFDSDSKVRSYFSNFLGQLSVDSNDALLDRESRKYASPLGRLFFQLLRQNLKGANSLSKIFQRVANIAESVDRLRRREKGMLFIPKFQTWIASGITILFIVALPSLSHEMFPTFITLKRFDLFTVGLAMLAIGFWTLHWMCKQPQKRLSPQLEVVFFLQFLSLFVESGQDLTGAWYRALEISNLKPDLKIHLERKHLTADTLDDFLKSLTKVLTGPWPELITGILWAKASGVGLSQYLQASADRQAERLMSQWDDEIRKLSLTTVMPLGFLIFPSVLFLLIGPQIVELVNL